MRSFRAHLAFLYVCDDWSYLWLTTFHPTLYNNPESVRTRSDAVSSYKYLLCFATSRSLFRAHFHDFCDEQGIPVIHLNSTWFKIDTILLQQRHTYWRFCCEKNVEILVTTEYRMVHHSVQKYMQKLHTHYDKFLRVTIQLSEQRMLAWHRL